VVIAILLVLVRFAIPAVMPDATLVGLLAGPVGALLIVLYATSRVIDKSIATGAEGMLFPILAIPALGLAFVVWAVATHRLSDGPRRATMVATILLASGVWALVKTGGFTASSFHNDLHWRWAKTAEDRLLSKSGNEPGALPPVGKPAEAPEPGG
jgi:hypothetical protein